jgi:hypothetical protein
LIYYLILKNICKLSTLQFKHDKNILSGSSGEVASVPNRSKDIESLTACARDRKPVSEGGRGGGGAGYFMASYWSAIRVLLESTNHCHPNI